MLCCFINKDLKHPKILVSIGDPGTSLPQILRKDWIPEFLIKLVRWRQDHNLPHQVEDKLHQREKSSWVSGLLLTNPGVRVFYARALEMEN